MVDILSNKMYKTGDEVYFITSSIDKPHLYIKCHGIIKSRVVKHDNVSYGIRLKKVFISKDKAKFNLHRRSFRTIKSDTGVAVQKRIYCLEYIQDNTKSISSGLYNLLRHYQFIVPSVFMCDDLYELDRLYNKARDVIKAKLELSLRELELDV